jgi:hypothetical protein
MDRGEGEDLEHGTSQQNQSQRNQSQQNQSQRNQSQQHLSHQLLSEHDLQQDLLQGSEQPIPAATTPSSQVRRRKVTAQDSTESSSNHAGSGRSNRATTRVASDPNAASRQGVELVSMGQATHSAGSGERGTLPSSVTLQYFVDRSSQAAVQPAHRLTDLPLGGPPEQQCSGSSRGTTGSGQGSKAKSGRLSPAISVTTTDPQRSRHGSGQESISSPPPLGALKTTSGAATAAQPPSSSSATSRYTTHTTGLPTPTQSYQGGARPYATAAGRSSSNTISSNAPQAFAQPLRDHAGLSSSRLGPEFGSSNSLRLSSSASPDRRTTNQAIPAAESGGGRGAVNTLGGRIDSGNSVSSATGLLGARNASEFELSQQRDSNENKRKDVNPGRRE